MRREEKQKKKRIFFLLMRIKELLEIDVFFFAFFSQLFQFISAAKLSILK